MLSLPIYGAELKEPLTLQSENGVLNILMIAKAMPIDSLPSSPVGWVFEICKRTSDRTDYCPSPASKPNYYGGTRLQVMPGDLLKIHLVNELPPVLDSDHANEPGHEFLAYNPVNVHTHGLLVSPRKATPENPTWGDNVFVLTFNSANGKPIESPHMHSTIRYDFTDYEIKIPANHPAGLFWFHPHAHGLALNQISAGLAGIITIGNVDDYLCTDGPCADVVHSARVRHLILKDAQILKSGQLQTQEDPDFCSGSQDPDHDGDCDGSDNTDDDGSDYTNGKWYFTVNGQQFPTIPIRSHSGEIWRITNASGSATYDLSLWNKLQHRDMLMQVLSVDGVSVSPTAGMKTEQLNEVSGGKFLAETCPIVPAQTAPSSSSYQPVCARRLHMMPSSRVEVWVTYRDSHDLVASVPKDASAVFRTNGYQTGPSGDSWPAANLASVRFAPMHKDSSLNVLSVEGQAQQMEQPQALATEFSKANHEVGADATCTALPPGHMRRIFYAAPQDNPDAFGLGYEEVDERGNVVGQAATDVTPFDPMHPTICVPLGPDNSPVTERWELVNVATEDHNFHIHQTKFRVLTKDEIAGTVLPGKIDGRGVMLDNLPLPHASGACGSNPPSDISNPISDWRAGLCHAIPEIVEIPFTIAGDFVYHCHILEHEDGGMMARIRVRAHH